MIKSRFSVTVYVQFLLAAGFVTAGVFLLANPGFGVKNNVHNIEPAVLPGFVIFFLGALIGYFSMRRVFILTIYPDQLVLLTRFSRFTLQKAEITRIQLMGRGSVLNTPADVLKITTSDGQSFSLPDQYCGNMQSIRNTLLDDYRKFVVDAPAPRPMTKLSADIDEEFVGNHFFSMNGIVFYGMTIVFIWIGISLSGKNPGLFLLMPVTMIVAFGFAFGSQLFYFRIAGGTLEIRNHLFLWYKKEYPLSDIAQIVFEHVQKRSNALRIRTIDFRSKSFAAGSLRDRHWVTLAAALKQCGIPVKNELALDGLPLTRDEEV